MISQGFSKEDQMQVVLSQDSSMVWLVRAAQYVTALLPWRGLLLFLVKVIPAEGRMCDVCACSLQWQCLHMHRLVGELD